MSVVPKAKNELFDYGTKDESGQYERYPVLPEEERAKGFVRPVRRSYTHKGLRPKFGLRPLTMEEQSRHADCNYIAYEEYPESMRPLCGKFWTEAQLQSGCGQTTTMGLLLAQTYARDPKYYGATFCATCGEHFSVEEFVWAGTEEIVGS